MNRRTFMKLGAVVSGGAPVINTSANHPMAADIQVSMHYFAAMTMMNRYRDAPVA